MSKTLHHPNTPDVSVTVSDKDAEKWRKAGWRSTVPKKNGVPFKETSEPEADNQD